MTTIIGFTLIVLCAFIVLDRLEPGGRRLAKIRGEDPVSYFGTAHSILFDHDFDLNNEFGRLPPDGRFWTTNQPGTGLPGSPWGIGYSILEIPLLALGTGIDAIAGRPADGYSQGAIFLYCIGSLLMVGGGMLALFLLLQKVGGDTGMVRAEHRTGYALFVTLAIFFGTNVGYYAFSQMSHASTFLFCSLFLMKWWGLRDSDTKRGWFVLGMIGGFLSICRWQDILYLGGPLLYDLWRPQCLARRGWWKTRLLYALAAGACWIPQVIEWRAIYGKYLTIPQGGGIFSFPPAHMIQVLLSSQSGWFVWTPLTILGVAGLVGGAIQATRIYLPWFVVLTLQLAVVGSVPFWSGVESFGARYMLSNTPLIAVGVFTALCACTVRVRPLLLAYCAACCVYTSLFAVQYRLNLVPVAATLTFSEIFNDKFHLSEVRRRKAAAKQAEALLGKGNMEAAIRLLEDAQGLGEDRDVEASLAKAYRLAGLTNQADAADLRYKKLLASRLY